MEDAEDYLKQIIEVQSKFNDCPSNYQEIVIVRFVERLLAHLDDRFSEINKGSELNTKIDEFNAAGIGYNLDWNEQTQNSSDNIIYIYKNGELLRPVNLIELNGYQN